MHDAKAAWVTWFAGFLLLAVGWALVTPLNGYPDEGDHFYLAVAVVRGEVFPHIGAYILGTGAITDVPVTVRSILSRKPCRGIGSPTLCRSAGPGHPGSDTVVTDEGRNFPLYYALVGWPSLAFPDRTGWYLMRLASAVLCCALLAAGACVLMSMRRRPLILASGLFLGLTPIALNMSGSVNPNGLEIAAAVCFWAVILALVYGTSVLAQRQLVRLGAVSGVLLVTCRFLGWAWIVLAVVLSLMTVGRAERRRFLSSRSAHVVLGCAAVAAVVMAAWTLTFRSYQTFSDFYPQPGGLVHAARASLDQQPRLFQEMLAYLGWLSLRPPLVAEVCWTLAVLALVAIVVVSNRRAGLVVLFGCVLAVALPFAVIVATYRDKNVEGWQGRYTLPLAVGVALLAVVPSRPRAAEPRIVVLLASAVILLALLGQIAVFEGAWGAYRHAQHWYVPVGRVFVALGAVVVVTNVAWADVRWRRKMRIHTREVKIQYEPSSEQ
jgi:Predicted membrane protein (DUF2142)